MLHGWAPSVGQFLAGTVAGILCTAAAHDMLARTVPNWMPLTIATIGMIESAMGGRLIASLLAGGFVFILSGMCWKRGWLGGGDVKLLGAVAVALPPVLVPPFVVAVALAGGVLSLFYLLLGRIIPVSAPRCPAVRPVGLLRRAWRLERRRLRRGGPLPYAIAIAAGGLFVIL